MALRTCVAGLEMGLMPMNRPIFCPFCRETDELHASGVLISTDARVHVSVFRKMITLSFSDVHRRARLKLSAPTHASVEFEHLAQRHIENNTADREWSCLLMADEP
jgi:hypothetical protein